MLRMVPIELPKGCANIATDAPMSRQSELMSAILSD